MDAWLGEATDYPRNETVARLFELAAAKYADRNAVVCGGSEMTFGELNRKANRLARRLRHMELARKPWSGLWSTLAEVALVAILKAGELRV